MGPCYGDNARNNSSAKFFMLLVSMSTSFDCRLEVCSCPCPFPCPCPGPCPCPSLCPCLSSCPYLSLALALFHALCLSLFPGPDLDLRLVLFFCLYQAATFPCPDHPCPCLVSRPFRPFLLPSQVRKSLQVDDSMDVYSCRDV